MASYPPGFLEELKARAPVSEVVGRRVKLARHGREFTGLSPFNSEKTPSFTVNDAKGFFHCFSSGEHGDVFSFLMKTEGLSFPEAVEAVANLVGMDVPKATPEERHRAERAKGLREAVEMAAHYFETQLRLPIGQEAMAYLKRRGLAEPTIRRFRLGYAPADRMSLLAALRREGFDDDVSVEAGLARRGDDGHVFGYFKDRIIYTIADAQGRPIGFGARALGDAQPKYLNSPEGPLFHKGETLYGLDLAREPAHKAGEIIVVEGYMDTIALAEAGFPNVVAPLGTAVTETQIKRLWRIAAAPVLCMDGDTAGRRAAGRAALRALPILEPGRTLKFALLNGGQDPDDLLRADGPTAIRAAIEKTVNLVDIVWQDALAEIDPRQPEERAALDKRLHDLAREVADPTVRHHMTEEFRARLRGLFQPPRGPASSSSRFPGRFPDRRGKSQPSPTKFRHPASPAGAVGTELREARVLYGCCLRPELAEPLTERLGLILFTDGELDRLRRALVEVLANEPAIDAAGLRATLIASGYETAIRRMDNAVNGRARPNALMGDAVDAAKWLGASLEAIERIHADRTMLERARAVSDEDRHAFEAVDLDAIARAQEASGGESRYIGVNGRVCKFSNTRVGGRCWRRHLDSEAGEDG